jgi:flagellar motor switch protein FliM
MAILEKKDNGVKLYDFKSNILLQPEELKSIKHLSEGFTEMLSFSLSNHFKRPLTAKYRETVVNKFTQAAKKLKMPVVIAKMSIEGLEGEFFIQIDRNIMYMLVDAFLGGDSKKADDRVDLTDIEERMLRRISERIMKYFEKALPASLKFGFEIREVVKKAENFEMHTFDDLITTIHFDVNFDNNQGAIVMGFPSFLLEPVLKRGQKKPSQEKKPALHDGAELKALKLKDVKVECRVVLSGVNIKLKDIVDIQVGDCVTLDHDISKPLTVLIGGKEVYTAMPGLKGKKLAVKITGGIKGENTNG